MSNKDEKQPQPTMSGSSEIVGKLSQNTYEELRKLDEYTLHGVRVVRRSNLGPMSVVRLPQFTDEQERRLESELRIERVLETMSKHKDNVLTPEENEEAFQVYMHRRRRQAHNLPPGSIGEDEFGPKKD